MNNNLETLKRACELDSECWDNSEIWKALQAFEKELRERKRKWEERLGPDQSPASYTSISVEEILGESP